MIPIAFAGGLVIGLLVGGITAFLLARRSQTDTDSVAETLSAKIVAKQAEHILQLAETKFTGKKELIDGTLKNVQKDLERVEKLMQDIGNGHTKIDTRLGDAAKVIKELSDTAGSLKNALTSNSSRGQWGERMAEDVLRLSGLIEGINYIKQRKLDAAGSKPDFTFLLPQNLKLNMDVKFSFSNYQRYIDASSDHEREDARKKFLRDVKDRIKEVQTRDYINPEDGTVDYVLLFIPNEQVFSFINEIDRSVIDEALRAKTILCSPLSLYAVLAVIRQSIDNFALEGKSQQMLSLFGGFRKQWDKFREQMEAVQTRFELVHKGYEELTGTRERQLERQLLKIEELRQERGLPAEDATEVFDVIAQENVTKRLDRSVRPKIVGQERS